MSSWLCKLGWGHRGFRLTQRQAVLGLALVLVVPAAIDVGSKLLGPRRSPDLRLWREVAADFLSNPSQPLYDRHSEYLYPPFFLTLIWPLAKMGEREAAMVFELFKWAALWVSLRTAWRLASPPGEHLPPFVTLGSLLMTARFIQNDFAHANVNTFLLLCVLGGVYLVRCEKGFSHQRREYLGGMAIGLAACVKITPALVLVYLLYRRQWRPMVGAAITAVVVLLIWPSLWIGWEQNRQTLVAWLQHVPGAFVRAGELWSIQINQSLTAIMNRLLGTAVAIDPDVRIALVVLPGWALEMIRAVFSVGLLAGLAVMCRGRVDPKRQPLAYAAEISLVQIAMLLLSGFTWKAHFVAMLLPNTVLLAYLADARYSGWRRVIGGLAVASFVMSTLTCDLLGRRGAKYAEAYGLIAASAVVVAVGLVIVRWRLRKADAHTPVLQYAALTSEK